MQNDFVGDHAAMRQALIEAGFGPVNLMKCLSRGNGPPIHEQGSFGVHGVRRPTLFCWGDVLRWAESRDSAHRQGQIDLGDTALGTWLANRSESVTGFAKRLEMWPAFVCRLVGHRTQRWTERLPPTDVLELIALETGIGVGTLVEDAIRIGREKVNDGGQDGKTWDRR